MYLADKREIRSFIVSIKHSTDRAGALLLVALPA